MIGKTSGSGEVPACVVCGKSRIALLLAQESSFPLATVRWKVLLHFRSLVIPHSAADHRVGFAMDINGSGVGPVLRLWTIPLHVCDGLEHEVSASMGRGCIVGLSDFPLHLICQNVDCKLQHCMLSNIHGQASVRYRKCLAKSYCLKNPAIITYSTGSLISVNSGSAVLVS